MVNTNSTWATLKLGDAVRSQQNDGNYKRSSNMLSSSKDVRDQQNDGKYKSPCAFLCIANKGVFFAQMKEKQIKRCVGIDL